MIKKYENSQFNLLFISFISVISLFMFTTCQSYIPHKFYFDSTTIHDAMMDPVLFDRSYLNTAKFFNLFGMNYYTPKILVNFFSWIVFILILITFQRINKSFNFSLSKIIFILFFTFMYFIYFTNYSKDIIVLIFFVIAINAPKIDNNILINILLSSVIYGIFFRPYWIIIFVISIISLLFGSIRFKRNIIYVFLFTIFVIAAFHFIKHGYITNSRNNINYIRMGSPNAKSMIKNVVSNSSILTDVLNYIYVLVTLFLPVQGIPSSAVIIYYLWIWAIIIYCFKNRYKINMKIILVLIIYLNVQALFEPDFGSLFRHQLAWFPIIFYGISNSSYFHSSEAI